MKCKTCLYGICIGTEVSSHRKMYECHKNFKPKFVGCGITECSYWKEKDNVIWIYGKRGE